MSARMAAARHLAQQSPSVALEKGAYRMRAPRISRPTRPSSSTIASTPSGAKGDATMAPTSFERQMAALVVLLACAVIASFGSAWWLYTTSRAGTGGVRR